MSVHTITLPSGGRFYNDKLPGGEIELEQMRAKEEAVLFAEGTNSSKKLDIVLRRLLVGCKVKPEEFLLSDRAYILLVLRTYAHGAEYNIPFRCSYCREQTEKIVDIAKDLNHKVIPEGFEDIEEPVQVTLPGCGDTVEGVFLRGYHEAQIANFVKRVKRQRRYQDEDPAYLYRLALQIISVNGQELSIPDRLRYVENLLSGDSNYFAQYMDQVEPGLDFELWLECGECGAENRMAFPYNEEFFRPRLGKLTRPRHADLPAGGVQRGSAVPGLDRDSSDES